MINLPINPDIGAEIPAFHNFIWITISANHAHKDFIYHAYVLS